MKLYYKAGACSLAPHIALAEANLNYETESVDLATKTTKSGANFKEISPKGSVPALTLDNGEVLTEAAVILLYIADQKAEANLAPKTGTLERYRCQEWLNFTASEIHKTLGMMFAADRMMETDSGKSELRGALKRLMGPKLDYLSEKLGDQDYLMGTQFTVVDAYLFTVLGWTKYVGIDLSPWKNVSDYLGRVAGRAGVQKAMKEEGLI